MARVTVLYFAWVRETMGISEEQLELPDSIKTVRELIDMLRTRDERGHAAFETLALIRAGVDQYHVDLDASLEGAKEIAFFPPVTGGEPVSSVSVQAGDFDLGREYNAFAKATDGGAICSFTGRVRRDGDGFESLTLEHYPGMTEAEIGRLCEEAVHKFNLKGLRVIHRFGELNIGEQIVLVLSASNHREAAFDGARYVMDFLKVRAPFWKLEKKANQERWVDMRESDQAALAQWDG